jgi:rRNA-processing protein FCF1
MVSSSRIVSATVLLDTNILIYSASEPYDIAYQLKLLGFIDVKVPAAVIEELEGILKRDSGKKRRFAKLALDIASKFKELGKSNEKIPVDDQLIQQARMGEYIIATSDSQLKRRLRKEDIPIIYLKNRRLISEGD